MSSSPASRSRRSRTFQPLAFLGLIGAVVAGVVVGGVSLAAQHVMVPQITSSIVVERAVSEAMAAPARSESAPRVEVATQEVVVVQVPAPPPVQKATTTAKTVRMAQAAPVERAPVEQLALADAEPDSPQVNAVDEAPRRGLFKRKRRRR